MLNYETILQRWVNDNIRFAANNQLPTSGHINDILELDDMPNEQLEKNGIHLIKNPKAPWLKCFEKKDLLRLSLLLFEKYKNIKIDSFYNLVLCIFLKDSKTQDIPSIKTLEDLIKIMNNTPPEFVIDSQPFKYIGKDIVINKKEFGLNESTIFQINTYKDEDDDVFISTLFLKN